MLIAGFNQSLAYCFCCFFHTTPKTHNHVLQSFQINKVVVSVKKQRQFINCRKTKCRLKTDSDFQTAFQNRLSVQQAFIQSQIVVSVNRHFARQHVLRDFLRFGKRVHQISAALVFVQLGDFALVFDIDHILH